MENIYEGSHRRTRLGRERRRGETRCRRTVESQIGSPTPTRPSTSRTEKACVQRMKLIGHVRGGERVLGHGSDSTAAADLLAGPSPPYLSDCESSLPLVVVVDLLGWARLNFSIHTSHPERGREGEEDVEQRRLALVLTSREQRRPLISSSR